MIEININEAKTHLSKYMKKVEKGEVIILCRHNVPFAEIRALSKPTVKAPRRLGLAEGTITISPEFYEPMTDKEIDAFYGGDIFPK